MLNLIIALKGYRSTVKSKTIAGSKSMSKNQLINLITTGEPSPTLRPAFEIKKYTTKLSKR